VNANGVTESNWYNTFMADRSNAKVVAIVGMSGAGKSAATDYLTDKGYPKVNFVSVIMDALRDANLEPTLENEKMMRDKLRREEGNDVVVVRVVEQIDRLIEAGQHRIIVDGMGAWLAYKVMKHEFPGQLTTVAVTAPRRLRHRRLATRPDRPLTTQEADARDYDEIENLNKGGVIAIADYYVPNEGSVDDLHRQLEGILAEVEF
jgi:dephospho-CoA kinase